MAYYASILEGKQAEDYKKRKEQMSDEEIDRKIRINQGENPGGKSTRWNPNRTKEQSREDYKRHAHAANIAEKRYKNDMNSGNQKDYDDYLYAVDAKDRHMRRHPEAYKEQGIFAECIFM